MKDQRWKRAWATTVLLGMLHGACWSGPSDAILAMGGASRLLGDAVSGLTITNSTGSAQTLYGLAITGYNCINEGSGCQSCSTPTEVLKVAMWTPTTLSNGSSTMVGQNYAWLLMAALIREASLGTDVCANAANTSYMLISANTTSGAGSSWTTNSSACVLYSTNACSDTTSTWNIPTNTLALS